MVFLLGFGVAERFVGIDKISVNSPYPRKNLIPEIKRMCIRERVRGLSMFELIILLFKNNEYESLNKSRQVNLLSLFIHDKDRKIKDYWPSIRMCSRNGYIVKDATMWCDYSDSLRYLGKDLHNAKYVCPDDLDAEHEKCMKKILKMDEEKALNEDLAKTLKKEYKYAISKLKKGFAYNLFLTIKIKKGLNLVPFLVLPMNNSLEINVNCGERGIRTPDTVSRIHTFQACALNHSAISPDIQ